MPFHSILFERPDDAIGVDSGQQPGRFSHLHLDQVTRSVVVGRAEYRLTPFIYFPMHDPDAVRYRHEIMRDLENEPVAAVVRDFAVGMGTMRRHLARCGMLRCKYQKERSVPGCCGCILRGGYLADQRVPLRAGDVAGTGGLPGLRHRIRRGGVLHLAVPFLRAERSPDWTRTFRIAEGGPLPTSRGEDVFRRIFAADLRAINPPVRQSGTFWSIAGLHVRCWHASRNPPGPGARAASCTWSRQRPALQCGQRATAVRS